MKASACLRPRLVGTVAAICAQVNAARGTKMPAPATGLQVYTRNETR